MAFLRLLRSPAASIALLVACSPAEPLLTGESPCTEVQRTGAARPTHVVLVVNDAMRRDRLGAYGGRAATPAFDAFAEEHLTFEGAYTQSPWTKPSIATLFTSLYPSQHGVASDPELRDRKDVGRRAPLLETDLLHEDFVTLAEVLGAAGYRTAAFVANPWMESRFGFGQGFDRYDDSAARDWEVSGRTVTKAALEWLASVGDERPFFVYLHYIDSHLPYGRLTPREAASVQAPPEDRFAPDSHGDLLVRGVLKLQDGRPVLAAAERPSRALLERAYDRGVADFDAELGHLLLRLRRSDAWPDTAVLVTSDHGEALFERGYGNHGGGLYDDEAAVPLAARLPGTQPARARVECLVGLVDILPTLCTYLGLRCPPSLQGRSFVVDPLAPAPAERRLLVTEGLMTFADHRSVRDRGAKLMFEPGGTSDGRSKYGAYSLFDLRSDPGEHRDRFASWLGWLRSIRAQGRLETLLTEAVGEYEAPPRDFAPVDPTLRQNLEALGYLDD